MDARWNTITTEPGQATGFNPPWWLRNPHLQTLWPVLVRTRITLLLRRERIELPDGDFIDLDWCGSGTGPILFILHGLEGSSASHYARSLMQAATADGWRSVVMHFRGCSGVSNRLPRSYHSGETGDLDYVARLLHEREPVTRIAAAGFSLGGNVLLKWLGEKQSEVPISTACAVSVPFDLALSARQLDAGMSRLYQWWLLRSLKHSVQRKRELLSGKFDTKRVLEARNFTEFDDAFTAPLHGFDGAADYYRRSSSYNFLINIAIPTLLLQAADDPFYHPDGLPANDRLAAPVRTTFTRHGGHVGFIAAANTAQDPWRDRTILRFLNSPH